MFGMRPVVWNWKYEMVLSPAVIPYEEFEKYREDLPYYRNIANEGVNVVA